MEDQTLLYIYHRRILIETYYRGRPYAEVAEELGVPEGTVKSRVYYGLRALRVATRGSCTASTRPSCGGSVSRSLSRCGIPLPPRQSSELSGARG